MMFSRPLVFLVYAATALAVAVPDKRQNNNICASGNQVCCNTVQNANQASIGDLLSNGLFLSGLLQDVSGQVGFSCNPITGIGGTLSSPCNAKTVCCTNNVNGLINIGNTGCIVA